MQVYANTRRRILSSSNPYHYSGSAFSGLGSPHTPPQYIWPLAIMVQALTSSDPYEQAGLLQVLLRMQCRNGLMHESVHVSVGQCSESNGLSLACVL
jgi:meiotically up-regulated gene 157 (Mug157) protein